MTEITPELYPTALDALTSIGRMALQIADQVNVTEMRSICEQHQTLAPLLDPTAYQRGGDLNLRDQAAFLRAFDEFVTALRRLDRSEDAR